MRLKKVWSELRWFFGMMVGSKSALNRPLHNLNGRIPTTEDYIGP